jgi:hypothetical protein
VDGGCIKAGGSIACDWWIDLCRVREGVGVRESSWFEVSLGCRLGNDESSSSWNNPWLEGGLLHDRFSRIFYLHVDSNIIVLR